MKNNLSTKYAALLRLADETTSRKEAIDLIHEADRIRHQMCQQDIEHPECHG